MEGLVACIAQSRRQCGRKLGINQKQHASVITILAEEIEDIKRPPDPPTRRIGFKLAGTTVLKAG